jgi:crossover junction endodeoxyribonuclease RuvC
MSIDPGITGALALIVDGHLQDVVDMPVADGSINGNLLSSYLKAWNPDTVVLEGVHCNGQNGSKANWSMGHCMGTIEGVCSALSHPLVKMSPQAWKRLSGLIGKDKEAGRNMALQLFPALAPKFMRRKDHNRAEAALIGRSYVMQMVRETNAS